MLSNLHDDLLIHIFSFFSLKQKLALQIICKKFKNIIEKEIEKECKSLLRMYKLEKNIAPYKEKTLYFLFDKKNNRLKNISTLWVYQKDQQKGFFKKNEYQKECFFKISDEVKFFHNEYGEILKLFSDDDYKTYVDNYNSIIDCLDRLTSSSLLKARYSSQETIGKLRGFYHSLKNFHTPTKRPSPYFIVEFIEGIKKFIIHYTALYHDQPQTYLTYKYKKMYSYS